MWRSDAGAPPGYGWAVQSTRRYLVTGATSGIGEGAASLLHSRGHSLILPARQEVSAGPRRCYPRCDLSDLAQVDALADAVHPPLHGVLHVAGVLHASARPGPEGVDLTWWTNLLGPARLTLRLLPRLSGDRRVIWISGEAHRGASLNMDRLGASAGLRAAREVSTAKLAWTLALQRHHPDLQVASFCPGLVRTNLTRDLPWWARGPARWWTSRGASPQEAAGAPVELLDGPWMSHAYTVRGVPRVPASHVSEAVQDAVWEWVQRRAGL